MIFDLLTAALSFIAGVVLVVIIMALLAGATVCIACATGCTRLCKK